MAGLIKPEDIAAVKDRVNIEDVVSEHVTLRRAGAGSLKGLCPFHDEKTPSFTVRPAVGVYHCFGCGQSGDVISFVMETEHLSFTESVERLAAKAGMVLRYEEGERPDREPPGRRMRLVEAHRVAEEFYTEALLRDPSARAGRDFLRAKGFDGKAAQHFGVGFAPRTGDALTAHLRAKGFSPEEMTTAGLVGQSSRGLYDRFRGRVVWPIRDITGDTVGFGARRIFEDDRIEAKYLNTSETPVYKKTHVLYGLDLAKKTIARERRAVVVEGYTDVMAAHLAGVDNAVATCGTAFGVDHIKSLRRIMRDEAGGTPARVIFTFDGDAAGQKAAMKAFDEDQRWASQSFVAVAKDGMDPCDLRLRQGDEAVRGLIEDAVPMFEFAVRTTIAGFDLDHAEGRVAAMRAVAPIIAGIRDQTLRPEYVRTVAGWIGVEIEQLSAAVRTAPRGKLSERRPPRREESPAASRQGSQQPSSGPGGGQREGQSVSEAAEPQRPSIPKPNPRDPSIAGERQLLQVMLQYPESLKGTVFDQLVPGDFSAPAHQLILAAAIVAGGPGSVASIGAWNEAVRRGTDPQLHDVLNELVVRDLPTKLDEATGRPDERYVAALIQNVQEGALSSAIADAMGQLRRLDPNAPGYADASRAASAHLFQLQTQLNALREAGLR
ncbi:DNA primase [Dermacoccus nishinomiyaensis]|uniref:DNA primase n=1 Tax=Dermacoccus nishinomiyaensis TaxID=1274 RepID=UPI00093F7998|nr:DNA primase [Dermacoccus nishinomiyaensis]